MSSERWGLETWNLVYALPECWNYYQGSMLGIRKSVRMDRLRTVSCDHDISKTVWYKYLKCRLHMCSSHQQNLPSENSDQKSANCEELQFYAMQKRGMGTSCGQSGQSYMPFFSQSIC